jgi:hypothetical protein
MSENLERAQRYHALIRDALLRDWDPIGVADIPDAQDEYDGYVASVHKLLIQQRSRTEVFDYLWWLETEHMGLKGDRQATLRFAERLLRLPQELDRISNSDG